METVRIVPPECSDDKYPTGMGTKVFSGDTEINNIKSIDVHYRVNDVVTATIEVISAMDDVGAFAVFMVGDPKTGDLKQVKRVEFEDGSVWDAG